MSSTSSLVLRAWVLSSVVQRKAMYKAARTIQDIEPPSLPLVRRGIRFSSQFLDGFEGMDHGAPSIGHLDANLIGDHLETISEVEVVARQHEKLSACLYYCRRAEQVQIFLALFSAGSLGLLISDAESSFLLLAIVGVTPSVMRSQR